MARHFECECGRQCDVEDELLGQPVHCPACGRLLGAPNSLASVASEGVFARVEAVEVENRALVPGEVHDLAYALTLKPVLVREEIVKRVDETSPALATPATFALAEDDAPILEPDEAGERPRRQKKKQTERLRQERRVLKTVSLGLALIWWGVLCFLLAIVLLLVAVIGVGIASMVGEFQDAAPVPPLPGAPVVSGPAAFFAVLNIVGGILQLLAALLIWAGKLFCCWTPKKSEARHVITVSFALDVPALGLMVFAFLALTVGPIILPAPVLQMLAPLVLILMGGALVMMVASFILFFVYLRRFAVYLEEPGIASEARDIMFWWVLLGIGWPVAIAVLLAAVSISFVLAALMLLILITGGFWWFYQYVRQWVRLLNLTGSLRDVLSLRYRV